MTQTDFQSGWLSWMFVLFAAMIIWTKKSIQTHQLQVSLRSSTLQADDYVSRHFMYYYKGSLQLKSSPLHLCYTRVKTLILIGLLYIIFLLCLSCRSVNIEKNVGWLAIDSLADPDLWFLSSWLLCKKVNLNFYDLFL